MRHVMLMVGIAGYLSSAWAGIGTEEPGGAHVADRVEIQDLQARYMFALDWQDADAYSATFTEDGVLDWAGGIVRGREAIRKEVVSMRAMFARREQGDAPARPARLRHFITNVVLDFDGDRATGYAYWLELNNDNRPRYPYVGGYGTYEDELRKVNGRWLFSRRKIYNEVLPNRVSGEHDPVTERRH
jgi:SnoaL-like protein